MPPEDPTASPETAPEDALWQFCLRVYAAPGVADACLALQDETGADIPLLLAALWSAVEGPGVLDADALTALDAQVADWRTNVVHPLRAARRWMKGAGHEGHPLRERIKADELAAERQELELIADRLAAQAVAGGGAPAAGPAVDAYLEWLGVPGPTAWRERLAPLVEAV